MTSIPSNAQAVVPIWGCFVTRSSPWDLTPIPGQNPTLLGKPPTPEQIELLSNEKQVTEKTPPCFLWHTWEDPVVKVENTLAFAMALRQHGVPFDLHIYQRGGHGMGLGKSVTDPRKFHPWSDDLLYWLHSMGYVK